MKQNVGPGVIVGVLVVVIAIVGFIGYRLLLHDPNQTSAQGAAAEKQIDDIKKNSAIYKTMQARQRSAVAGTAGSPVGHGAYGAGMKAAGQ